MLLFNIHAFISEKVREKRRAKAKTGSNADTIQTLLGSGKSGASAYYANFTSVENYDYEDDMSEPADACQAHNDPVDPGSDDGEDAADDDDDDWKNDTFSCYVALDDVLVFEAAELDAIALLADTWDNNLGPEVSKCTNGASERTSLPSLRKGERKR